MKYFKLFANCLVVKGYSRGTICDLHRGKVYFVPNHIIEFFSQEKIHLSSIEENQEYKKWSQVFLETEIGFITKNPELFPDIELHWDTPELINNVIIEADSLNLEDFVKVMIQLNELKVKHMEIRFYKTIRTDILEILPDLLKKGSVKSAYAYIPFKPNIKSLIEDLLSRSNQLMYILIHSSPIENNNQKEERVTYLPYALDNNLHCGMITTDYFSITIKTFTESQKYNTCLNRKVAICDNGDIKNCPSMSNSHGNINQDQIKQIVKTKAFQNVWNISKDQISVCRDCEFRYVCTDCRAYIENPDDIYSKPLKCGYDPYTNVWEDWATNPLKKKAVEFYEMKGIAELDE